MEKIKWNYTSKDEKSSGYDDVLDILKSNYTKKIFGSLNLDKQNQMINEVFEIYRGRNIYPITYYNDKGIEKEIKKCIKAKAKYSGCNEGTLEALDNRQNQGKSLCRFIFPNLQNVVVRGEKDNTLYCRFYDDDKLKKAISFALKYDKDARPINILRGLRMIGGGFGSNFPIMKAQALYEYYVPKNGVIYDYASGFGGRMLGALTSKNNYTYIGTDPSTETYKGLVELSKHIKSTINRDDCVILYNKPSEELKLDKGTIDFAFSSPPYFNLEIYTDENTQSYNQGDSIDEWFISYVEPTIRNIHNALKNNGIYAVNISDFNIKRKRVKFVEKWIKCAEKNGFTFSHEIPMKVVKRRGYGHKENDKKPEGVFLFQKQQ